MYFWFVWLETNSKGMPLTKEERTDIILLVGSDTTRHVACTFNETHKTQITHDTVAKLIQVPPTTTPDLEDQRQQQMKVHQRWCWQR